MQYPDRDADAACRPAARRMRVALTAQAPTRGSAFALQQISDLVAGQGLELEQALGKGLEIGPASR